MPDILESKNLQQLIEVLSADGYRVVAPTVRDNAIIYDEIATVADLPKGWTDKQDGGNYRLEKRKDDAFFGYNVGPHSWKKFLHPPVTRLFRAKLEGNGFQVVPEVEETPDFAFFGVRSCELHAIAIHDRVLIDEQFVDPVYQARREKIFTVAVNCGQAGGTCFCVSMNTGPKASFGYDIVLTEVLDGERHYFTVETGSEKGAEVMSKIPLRKAEAEESETAEKIVAETVLQMGRYLDTTGIRDLLIRNYDHPRWDEVASRCLTCANCTMVCPTCFCSTVEDVTDLKGHAAERWRKWDSCFTLDFSYIHGGNVRSSAKSRYRQWMTHKLSAWIDQFETSGCVGCGRCITWCPTGIDITEEVRAIRETEVSD
ncbi:MAG: 4Fe-4S dicluster domain-containing protein [Acidobacteriota bacterium]|nr:4Fe-4S dicluster domain-containing protein [Acidobacteriota bacterium]